MGLFSSLKGKLKGNNGPEIIIEPDIVTGLKDKLKLENKDIVRFEVVDFG